MRETGAKRDALRAQAKKAFDAEMIRQNAGDCPNANTTYDSNVCLGNEVGITDRNLQTYETAIRDLLGLKYAEFPGQNSMPGSARTNVTPEQSVAEFDHLEQLWQSYSDGTGGPGFEMQCHLLLVRSHILELNSIYAGLLRL